MPYLKREDRERVDYTGTPPIKRGAELNFLITRLIADYLKSKGTSYHVISDIFGALSGAKAEFIVRVVNPYEDTKRKENGEIYYL